MDSTERIILSGSLNKSSKNENMSLNAVLSGSKKLLPEDGIENVVDLYKQYVKERENSDKFRLVVNINPYCSNVLFNPFTEIVRRNGNGTTFLNYVDKTKGLTDVTGTIGKGDSFKWTAYDAIRDTQLSNETCGFEYYCGLDIFNNHILRNKTFKSINYSSLSEFKINDYKEVYHKAGYNNRPVQEKSTESYKYVLPENFNTIDDYMRDRNGVIVQDIRMNVKSQNLPTAKWPSKEVRMPLHLYQNYDVYTFEDCIKNKLIERNGWFGFSNPSMLNTIYFVSNDDDEVSSTTFKVAPNDIEIDCEEEGVANRKLSIELNSALDRGKKENKMNINKTINNKKYCDFIDMYPTRELYSFSPLYNERLKRYEKNWNYCLTYPSKSITKDFNNKDFPFFTYMDDGTISLRAIGFDEYIVDDDGRSIIEIYSICKHGLKAGDSVNIYREKELYFSNSTVVSTPDKYTFRIFKESYDIGNNEQGTPFKISFKRVLSNVECEYYVRVFSRLPNFKFANAEINDYNLYEDEDLNLIEKYSDPSDPKCDFENHIADMSFAQTSYGDNDTEIVYTDDIDISYLKDNLGRPLSDIYLTIVKNNKGYKEWYSSANEKITDETNIEFSHCFGYNSSSFLLSEEYRKAASTEIGNADIKDVRDICANSRFGLYYKQKNNDEIIFDEIRDFYGDICYYCPIECDEYSLGNSMGRFNTVQREFVYYGSQHGFDAAFNNKSILFNSLKDFNSDSSGVMFHDEIIDDENTSVISEPTHIYDLYSEFNIKKHFHHSSFSTFHDTPAYIYNNMLNFSEGYYYKMHYRIPLKTVSMSISKDDGITYELFSISSRDSKLKIKTVYENNLSLNDKLTLYDKIDNKFYYLTVSEIYTKFYFECSVKNEDLTEGFKGNTKDLENYNLIKRNQETPEYAKLIKDGSSTYYWRNIIPNGIERNDSKVYPFTNGAFYINKQINFFLRRQDPEKINLGVAGKNALDYAPNGEFLPIKYFDNLYYDSEEIETC